MKLLTFLVVLIAILSVLSGACAETDYSKYNERVGKAFLQKKAAEPGVLKTEDGIYYEVLKQGTGTRAPKPTDTVKVHYTGTLVNGKVFDSSHQRGEPATFGLNQVIPGWTKAVSKMREGDSWRIFLPPELAYGARGAGRDIGPNATLLFDIDLIEIVTGKEEL